MRHRIGSFLVAALAAAAFSCASTPKQPETSAADGNVGAEASADDSGNLAEVALEDAVSVETSKTAEVAPPEDCQFEPSPNVWALRCPEMLATVSKNEFSIEEPESREIMVVGQMTDFESNGYTVKPGKDADLTPQLVGRFAEVSQGADAWTTFFALRRTADGSVRRAHCEVLKGDTFSPEKCDQMTEALERYADTNRVDGIVLYGTPIAFPAGSELNDRSVSFNRNSMSWVALPGSTHVQVLKSQSEQFLRVFKKQGVTAQVVPQKCAFRGANFDCNEIKFQLPGRIAQSSILLTLPAKDGAVALICDIAGPLESQLPEPCTAAFELADR